MHDFLQEVYPYMVGFFLFDAVLYVRPAQVAFVSVWKGFRVLEPGLHLVPPWPGLRVVLAGECAAGPCETAVASMRKRRAGIERHLGLLRALSSATTTVFLVALPIAIYLVSAPEALVIALAVFALSYAATLWSAERALRGGGLSGRERVRALSPALLFPPSAGHLLTVIERDLYAVAPASTLAAELLDRSAFIAHAARRLHRWRALADAQVPAADERSWRAESELMEALLRGAGSSAAEVLAMAPPRTDPTAGAWCPACRADYRLEAATCSDCGLVLQRY